MSKIQIPPTPLYRIIKKEKIYVICIIWSICIINLDLVDLVLDIGFGMFLHTWYSPGFEENLCFTHIVEHSCYQKFIFLFSNRLLIQWVLLFFHQCLKFKTDQAQDAKKMEKLNNIFFTLMARGPEGIIFFFFFILFSINLMV